MKAIYNNGERETEVEVCNFYHDIAEMMAHESVKSPKMIYVSVPGEGEVVYKISLRSDTIFIVEISNSMPDFYAQQTIKPVFLTCVKPEKNAYKFYKLEPCNSKTVRASYGRMGVQKGQLFGERSFEYPRSMYWIKYFEKISKGYVDRSDLYLSEVFVPEQKTPMKRERSASTDLFDLLYSFAKKAVAAAKVEVPITKAIIEESNRLLEKMRKTDNVEEFNNYLLELISILQRPVRTGDGRGVKEIMAQSSMDFSRIIEREDDLIQAMQGMEHGNSNHSGDFKDHNIFVAEATEAQYKQVMKKLTPTLQKKVRKVYRVIPKKQKLIFDQYIENHEIKTVKQYWHGSRNQNWLSIMIQSLSLNPDAIITGKMYGNGLYFAPDSMKSWGYTSNGKWTEGSSQCSIMGLYAVAYGVPYDVDSWSPSVNYKQETLDRNCNCCHAHKGSALLADEVIFYSEKAVCLQYIVEFDN